MTISLCNVELPASKSRARVTSPIDTVVALPVQNEEACIAACLTALSRQTSVAAHRYGIVVCLNNCTDATEAIVRNLPLSCELRVLVQDHPDASAGWARRLAMEAAASWLEENDQSDGTLLTTDADSCVPPDWIALNLREISFGADLVAGKIALNPHDAEALPRMLHDRGQREATYDELLSYLKNRITPSAYDPWPCHSTESGASLAVRLRAYRTVGGIPPLRIGEDRAFVGLLKERGLRVRHSTEIVVQTSGRLKGRAVGGAADTMRLRCNDPDAPCDELLQPVLRVVAEALLQRAGGTSIARTIIRRRMLKPRDLDAQIKRARVLIGLLQSIDAAWSCIGDFRSRLTRFLLLRRLRQKAAKS